METKYFVSGLFLVIFFARINPCIGAFLYPEITVKYISVFCIFLISGFTLPTKKLIEALLQWDIHLFIQIFTFVGFPIIVGGLLFLLKSMSLHPALTDGLIILSTLPPPVSSAIILTRAVGGNDAVAVFNSAFGCLAGIFITPELICKLMKSEDVRVPHAEIFLQLFITVFVPLVIGQFLGKMYYYRLRYIPFKTIEELIIYFVVYTNFCSTFSSEDLLIEFMSILKIAIISLLILGFTQAFVLFTARWLFEYSRADAVAMMYVASHKNLVLGIPVIKTIYAGSPDLVFRMIPLFIYNPMQIVLGGLSVPFFKMWVDKKPTCPRRRQ